MPSPRDADAGPVREDAEKERVTDPTSSESPGEKLQTLCFRLAKDNLISQGKLDRGEFHRLTLAAFNSGEDRAYPHSKDLEDELAGWARSALIDDYPQRFLQRLTAFKRNLNSEALCDFLAMHLARRRVLGLSPDALHLLASERADQDPEFSRRVAVAIEAVKERLLLSQARTAPKVKLTPPSIPRQLNSPSPVESDFSLCAAWHNVPNPRGVTDWPELVSAVGSTTRAIQLFTARMGERAAMNWYKEMGHNVLDVSLTQLDSNRADGWLTHDILVDGHKKVDVKTARQAILADGKVANYYSRFLVRQLDGGDVREDVHLLGVLTPYLSTERFDVNKRLLMKFLGEVRRSSLTEVSQILNDHPSGFRFSPPIHERRLPGWFFSSSDLQIRIDGYIEGLKAEYKRALGMGARIGAPDAIVQLMRSGHEFDQAWIHRLLEIVGRGPFASVLVMLVAFSDWARRGATGPWDGSVVALTIPHSDLIGRSFLADDPGNYVIAFRRALNALASKADVVGLAKFRDYVLRGAGLLTATDPQASRRVTLLAYCGGPRCGYAPLVFGVDETCELCGKLVCPATVYDYEQCGFCSAGCPGLEARRGVDVWHEVDQRPVHESPVDQRKYSIRDPAFDRYTSSPDDQD